MIVGRGKPDQVSPMMISLWKGGRLPVTQYVANASVVPDLLKSTNQTTVGIVVMKQ